MKRVAEGPVMAADVMPHSGVGSICTHDPHPGLVGGEQPNRTQLPPVGCGTASLSVDDDVYSLFKSQQHGS